MNIITNLPRIKLHMKLAKTMTHPHPPSGGGGKSTRGATIDSFSLISEFIDLTSVPSAVWMMKLGWLENDTCELTLFCWDFFIFDLLQWGQTLIWRKIASNVSCFCILWRFTFLFMTSLRLHKLLWGKQKFESGKKRWELTCFVYNRLVIAVIFFPHF